MGWEIFDGRRPSNKLRFVPDTIDAKTSSAIAVLKARLVLDRMSDEDRLTAFNHYCKHCGSSNPACHCSNDE